MMEASRIPPVLRFCFVQDVSGLELVLSARTTSATDEIGEEA